MLHAHLFCTPRSFPPTHTNDISVSRFMLAGSARPSSHMALSSRGSRGSRRGRTACRGIQCRMKTGSTDNEGRPTKGFAQPQESRKTTAKGKGKVRAPPTATVVRQHSSTLSDGARHPAVLGRTTSSMMIKRKSTALFR